MAKVAIAHFEDAPVMETGPEHGERTEPGVETRAVFDGNNRAIHARLHHIPAGKGIVWDGGRQGHMIYVWDGSIDVKGTRLERGSVLVVEHHAKGRAEALEPSTVLVFNRPMQAEPGSDRAGGHIHILPADRVPRSARMVEKPLVGGALFADAHCPTCEMWLHETTMPEGNQHTPVHSHNEDEMIVVIGGEIVLGRQRHGPGTALLIEANTLYSFDTGPDGLAFINFRPHDPTYRLTGSDQDLSESAMFHEKVGTPPHVTMAG